ncbi:MAG: hypothetical protein IPH77_15830 [Ignavibacteria bacterium]|nr:hypothetical protein [Ignavibacteria bacterium]
MGYAINYLKQLPSLSASCNWYGFEALAATVVSKINGNVNYFNIPHKEQTMMEVRNGFRLYRVHVTA